MIFLYQASSSISAYLTMKSNSDPASISTPSRVDTAPSRTGANMCSRASIALWFLSPMAVRKAWTKEKLRWSHSRCGKVLSCAHTWVLLIFLMYLGLFSNPLLYKNDLELNLPCSISVVPRFTGVHHYAWFFCCAEDRATLPVAPTLQLSNAYVSVGERSHYPKCSNIAKRMTDFLISW